MGLRSVHAPSASHNCSGVARNFQSAKAARAAGLVSPSASAFSTRRVLAPSRSETSFWRETQNPRMKSAWRPIFRAEFRASLYFSLDMYVWCVTHIQHADQIPTETRIPCRRPTLVAAANRQPVACRPRLSQLSPQSLHSPELSRLSFRGEAPQPCPLWPPARTPLFPVRARGIGSPSPALVRQRACSAGTALPGRTALCQSFETAAGQGLEKSRGLNRAENCAAADQFRRLGVAAAGHFAGAGSTKHLRFSGRPRRDDRGRTR